jgi:hypothetical protein
MILTKNSLLSDTRGCLVTGLRKQRIIRHFKPSKGIPNPWGGRIFPCKFPLHWVLKRAYFPLQFHFKDGGRGKKHSEVPGVMKTEPKPEEKNIET